MKKYLPVVGVPASLLLICAMMLGFAQLRAQYAPIPDTSFRQALVALGYGGCFDITGTMLDTTCTAVLTADSLNVGVSDISDLTGIGYFKHLRYLNCYHNPFTRLPMLPDSLVSITSYDGLLDTMPPVLPSTLQYLNLGDNFITTMPPFPASLTYITVETNLLTTLPPLPAGLQHLSCLGNLLTSLPPLPSTLTYLDCGTNMIDSLPALPAPLTLLFCGINNLTSIPALPVGLTRFYCNNNQLTSVPTLPAGLSRFYCFGNQITSLPALPSSLIWIDCSYNLLTSLPALPDSMYTFDCHHNLNLYCLPRLGQITYLDFDSTGVGCLPDMPQGNISSTPALSSMSICGISNSHGCPTYTGIIDARASDISIYPNPANDILTIRSSLTSGSYTLTDMQGRTLISGSIDGTETVLRMSSLVQGTYLLHLDGGVYKVVKE